MSTMVNFSRTSNISTNILKQKILAECRYLYIYFKHNVTADEQSLIQ